MIFKRKINFKVEHEGRGGAITFKYKGEHCRLPIEMAEKGNFYIATGGMSEEKALAIRPALRSWLNQTDRDGWFIDVGEK